MTLGPAKGRSESVLCDPESVLCNLCGQVLAGTLQEGMRQSVNLQNDRFMARKEASGYCLEDSMGSAGD